ncbi:MAG TPA: hypothetical protein VHN16_11280 [Streptosporangiaceae bacterium]|jgi:hypothetical protein|nr:hypothetical protein [Streptosporangiaceae bacterium]
MSGNTEDALDVLRGVWSAQGQTAEDIEEACGNTKSCKRMADVGFDGLAEETDGDLRLAWRTQLAREGKLNPDAGSVRDLVLPPVEVR